MALILANYEISEGWAYPILRVLAQSERLQVHLATWRTGRLSDLVFSIETRLGALATAAELLSESLQALLDELRTVDPTATDSTHRFRDTAALRRALLAGTYYIADARTCYENLADFYRESLRQFFGESISEAASRAVLPTFSADRAWANKLWAFRNDLLHDRAPWLAFEVTGSLTLPEIAAVFTLDWRHGTGGAVGTVISAKDFQAIRKGLGESLVGARDTLVSRMEALT